LHNLQLLRQTHVIVVTKHNHIAGAELDGALEVTRISFIMLVYVPAHRKRRVRREVADNVRSAIGRAIIADYQLVRKTALGGYALKLLHKKAVAIEGNQSDG
jgi:hypothetical protein